MTERAREPAGFTTSSSASWSDSCALPSGATRARLGVSSEELDRAFEALADVHGVVLHPGSHNVWAIHPFSLAPTLFLVESGDKKWWGSCAWCSLGIAVLAGGRCTITTTLGADGEQVRLTVEDGQVTPSDLVFHFPIHYPGLGQRRLHLQHDAAVQVKRPSVIVRPASHSSRRRQPVRKCSSSRAYYGTSASSWTKTVTEAPSSSASWGSRIRSGRCRPRDDSDHATRAHATPAYQAEPCLSTSKN